MCGDFLTAAPTVIIGLKAYCNYIYIDVTVRLCI